MNLYNVTYTIALRKEWKYIVAKSLSDLEQNWGTIPELESVECLGEITIYKDKEAVQEETGNPIKVWAWEDAPVFYKVFSHHGGDEDWVALIPKGKPDPLWAQEGGPFGCCDVQRVVLECGSTILIGAHA